MRGPERGACPERGGVVCPERGGVVCPERGGCRVSRASHSCVTLGTGRAG